MILLHILILLINVVIVIMDLCHSMINFVNSMWISDIYFMIHRFCLWSLSSTIFFVIKKWCRTGVFMASRALVQVSLFFNVWTLAINIYSVKNQSICVLVSRGINVITCKSCQIYQYNQLSPFCWFQKGTVASFWQKNVHKYWSTLRGLSLPRINS